MPSWPGSDKLNLISRLRETLHIGQPGDAAETVGLLSRLDVAAVEKRLGERLREWPRLQQDRALRLLAAGGAPERGWALLSVLDQFDPILQPLAVDEIGMSGEASAYEQLMRLVSDELPRSTGPYLRLKAIEALGRLHSTAATELLREIVEAKKRWRWVHHAELRIAALQALEAISPASAESLRAQSGFSEDDLSLNPRATSPKSRWLRQRRYPRVRLKATVPATATSERETVMLDMRGLSLSGGLATGAKHLPPGTLVSLRLGSGLRPIRAQAIMRDARAQGLSFEFASMDLDDRARLRSFLRQNGAALTDSQEAEEMDVEHRRAGEVEIRASPGCPLPRRAFAPDATCTLQLNASKRWAPSCRTGTCVLLRSGVSRAGARFGRMNPGSCCAGGKHRRHAGES